MQRGITSSSRLAIVLYHYPCPDGAFAAAAARLKFKQTGRPAVFVPHRTYAPLQVDDVLDIARENGSVDVYLLDFSGTPGFAAALALSDSFSSVCVVDHHKTAAEELDRDLACLPKGLDVHFDMKRSGAMLALDYFKPIGISTKQQRLYELIQDADLWKWELEGSREFHAGFASLGFELDATKNSTIFEQLLSLDPDEVIEKGRSELKRQQEIVSRVVREAYLVELGGRGKNMGQALAVTVASDLASLRSQIGNELAQEAKRRGVRAIGLVAYREKEMSDAGPIIKVSMRSKGDEDTTVLSQEYGGGGHKNASSFMIKGEEFKMWRI